MSFFESWACYFLLGLIGLIVFVAIIFMVAAGRASRDEEKILENMNKEQD